MDKTIKETLSAEYGKVYAVGSDMHKYCVGHVSGAIMLSCGMLYCIEKPKIETHFCFGYSDWTDYDQAEATKDCVRSKNDGGEYFKYKNLQDFDRENRKLEEDRNYFVASAYGEDCKIGYLINAFDIIHNRLYKDVKATCITKEDLKAINALIDEERAKFEKRLNTYLKRYGTTKLKCWTYWRDE